MQQPTAPKSSVGDETLPKVQIATSNSPVSNYSEFLNRYTKITSIKQRTEYINAFDADYMEYRSLFAVVDRSCKLFIYLEKKLGQEVEGSFLYERIKEEIQTNYEICKNDIKYQESRRKFLYLHQKLLHIKGLVLEFNLRVPLVPEPQVSSDEEDAQNETSNSSDPNIEE